MDNKQVTGIQKLIAIVVGMIRNSEIYDLFFRNTGTCDIDSCFGMHVVSDTDSDGWKDYAKVEVFGTNLYCYFCPFCGRKFKK